MAASWFIQLYQTFLLCLFFLNFSVLASPLDALPVETGAPSILNKRGTLQDLFNKVKPENLVQTGASQAWSLFPFGQQEETVYAPSKITGCTVVIIANGHGLVIGHYAQNDKNDNCLLDEASSDKILEKLTSSEAEVDVDDQQGTYAWFFHADNVPTSAPGYKKIYAHLQDDLGIPTSNIKPQRYPSGSGTEDSGWRLVVQWQPVRNGNSATLSVYINQDIPSASYTYDCNGNPITLSMAKILPRALGCARTVSVIPVPIPTPVCTWIAPRPPVIDAAYCSCSGRSYSLLEIPGTPVAVESSCAYTSLPGATGTISGSFPVFTDSAECKICTPYAANGANCRPLPNCQPRATPVPQIL